MNVYFAISGALLVARSVGLILNFEYAFSIYYQQQYGIIEKVSTSSVTCAIGGPVLLHILRWSHSGRSGELLLEGEVKNRLAEERTTPLLSNTVNPYINT